MSNLVTPVHYLWHGDTSNCRCWNLEQNRECWRNSVGQAASVAGMHRWHFRPSRPIRKKVLLETSSIHSSNDAGWPAEFFQHCFAHDLFKPIRDLKLTVLCVLEDIWLQVGDQKLYHSIGHFPKWFPVIWWAQIIECESAIDFQGWQTWMGNG